MTALDQWHRERLSAAAKAKLQVFEVVRRGAPGNEVLLEEAFREFVAELTADQLSILAEVLTELSTNRALH